MPLEKINGVKIYYELLGASDTPLVLVHGSWGSHRSWDMVVPSFAERFRVITYDRRGHSRSERPLGPGSIHEDVADLAALIERLGLGPAYVAGGSWGGIIALRLAIRRSDLVRAIACHEPPLLALIADAPEVGVYAAEFKKRNAAVAKRLEAGDNEGAARLFVETLILGPGMWERLAPHLRQTFLQNGPTYLDECKDPNQMRIDLEQLKTITKPTLITQGDQSPAMFSAIARIVAAAIPGAEPCTLEGAGHLPQATHPSEYVEALTAFFAKHAPQLGSSTLAPDRSEERR